ncbi:MAG: 30S ribosomal protein S3 [Candidatus Moranbacteria bacterium]|nr:30S ribosomal protein S3 [Candidatus Moranbacteria bacterium]
MGHKVNPRGLRIGITCNWRSRWYSKKEYPKQLKEDIGIRRSVEERLRNAAIGGVDIERSSGLVRVIVKTARPGIIIGRGGTGVEDLKKFIKDNFFKNKKVELKVEVEEIKNSEENAQVVARNIAEQLEKRIPFRRILKGIAEQAMEARRIKGIKIEISGRLGGADMSRREWLSRGTLPLHTLRADIDFAKDVAKTTFGVIGVKVWIYRGEKFDLQNDR